MMGERRSGINSRSGTPDLVDTIIFPPRRVVDEEHATLSNPLCLCVLYFERKSDESDESRRCDASGFRARCNGMTAYTDENLGWVVWDIEKEYTRGQDGQEVAGDTFALIAKLWTDPVHRGKGVARQNMKAAIEEIRAQHGSISIRLLCEPFDDAHGPKTYSDKLQVFYESLGFTATGKGAEMVLEMRVSDTETNAP